MKLYLSHPDNLEVVQPFENEIDKEDYRDYLKHVHYEIYFFKVIKRLEKNIYHSFESVI